MSSVHIDTFSGAAADLPRRQHKDELAVMRALVRDPRVSCFDRSEYSTLDRTLVDLKMRSLIVETIEPYPWHRFHVTPEGLKMLDCANDSSNGIGRRPVQNARHDEASGR